MHSPLKPTTQLALDRTTHLQLRDRSHTLFCRYQWPLYRLSLLLLDALFIGLSFRIAFWIRFNSALPFFRTEVVPSFPFYQGISALLVILYLGIFAVAGLYQRRNLLGGTTEYALVFRATSIGILMVVVFGFLQPDFILARGWLALAWALSFLFVAAQRFILRRVVYRLRTNGYFLSKALIVGANEEGRSLAQQLLSWQTSGLYVVGFIDDQLPAGNHVMDGLHAYGGLKSLQRCVAQHGVEELVITTSALSRQQMIDVFEKFGMRDDLNLRLSSGLFEIITTGLQVTELGFVPLVRVNRVRLTGADWVIKKVLDYTLALAALGVILPLCLLLALIIRLDSSGPAFHRRRVMGVNGSTFSAFKFRTMHVNGDAILGEHPELVAELAQNHKLKDDPRVTRVGAWLRKTSLDELPQIFNVMLGQMSLVGPRMISPDEMEMYEEWGMNLLTVQPGITGLWQVSGRSDLSYADRVRLDMHYVRNWTIWLDLQILFQTIPAVLKSRGAY